MIGHRSFSFIITHYQAIKIKSSQCIDCPGAKLLLSAKWGVCRKLPCPRELASIDESSGFRQVFLTETNLLRSLDEFTKPNLRDAKKYLIKSVLLRRAVLTRFMVLKDRKRLPSRYAGFRPPQVQRRTPPISPKSFVKQ